jgi:hypothetical protein
MNTKGKKTNNKAEFDFNEEINDWLIFQSQKLNQDKKSIIEGCIKQAKDSSKEVRIKDYERNVHYLMSALNGVGIKIDYLTTDLVYMTNDMLQEKGGEMSLMDFCEIKHKHQDKWTEYFKKIND